MQKTEFHTIFCIFFILLSTFGKQNSGYNSGASTLNRNTNNITFDRRNTGGGVGYAYTSPRHQFINNNTHVENNTTLDTQNNLSNMQQQTSLRAEGSMSKMNKNNNTQQNLPNTNNNSNTPTPKNAPKSSKNNQNSNSGSGSSSSGCTVSSSNLIQATILLIIMLAAALAGLAFLVKQLAKLPSTMVGDRGVAHKQSLCRSRMCRNMDKELISVMSRDNVSVCENSYHYFCGKYTSLDSKEDLLRKARNSNISEILSQKDNYLEETEKYFSKFNSSAPASISYMYNFWESCVDLNKIRLRRGSEPIQSYIKQNINWPALNLISDEIENLKKKQRKMHDIYKLPAKIIRQTNSAFFLISKEETEDGSEILAIKSLSTDGGGGITLDTNSYSNDRGDKLKFYKDFIRTTLLQLRAKKEENKVALPLFQKTMNSRKKRQNLRRRQKKLKPGITRAGVINQELENIIFVEKELAKIKQEGADLQPEKTITTLKELNELTNFNLEKPVFNWITLFREILGNFDENEKLSKLKVSVDSISTLREIVEFTNRLYPRARYIGNSNNERIQGAKSKYRSYIAWRSIGNLFDETEGKVLENFKTFQSKMKINNIFEIRQACRSYLDRYYTYVLGFLYKLQNKNTDIEKAKLLVDQIRKTVVDEVKRVDYKTPEYIKNFALPKIYSMQISVGYPEFFDNENAAALLDGIHAKVKILPEAYFENMINLKDDNFKQIILNLVQKQGFFEGINQGLDVLNGSWIYDPTKIDRVEITGSDLVYEPHNNELYIPLGYLQYPNFHSFSKIPDAVIYSSTGYEIARKMLTTVIMRKGFFWHNQKKTKWNNRLQSFSWNGGEFFNKRKESLETLSKSMKLYFGETRWNRTLKSSNFRKIRATNEDILLNSVAIDAASSAMTINFGREDDDIEELLLETFENDNNWSEEGGLKKMSPGKRLFLVNLSRGMCIKEDNGIARARSTKNFEKFKLEESLRVSNTFGELKCEKEEEKEVTTTIAVTTTEISTTVKTNETEPEIDKQPVPLNTTENPL